MPPTARVVSTTKLLFFGLLFLLPWNQNLSQADIGLISFWVPELYALLDVIASEGNELKTYTFGARKFYVTTFRGHNVIAVNSGVGISNSAATAAILLQKFPTIDRIVGSGIAVGVDPALRVNDVVIPEKWALYQLQHFAKEVEVEGVVTHEFPPFQLSGLMGDECGDGFGEGAPSCEPGKNTWNYTFIYPTATYDAEAKFWFDVDPEMFQVAQTITSQVELENSVSDAVLDYQPVVTTGGAGISGPTFLDNAEYRQYAFDVFGARAVDMETAGAAYVAHKFGKKFIFFRSLSDLAGAEQDGNVMGIFFQTAAVNAVKTMSAFLGALPIDNKSDLLPTPVGHVPGDAAEGLLGVLSFYEPELDALKNILSDGNPEEITFGGITFYRGKIHGADVIATLTGVGIANAAMTTALMVMLFPGIEQVTGGGIAGGIDPNVRVGDVVIPDQWALYQHQLYAKEVADGAYDPVIVEREFLVGSDCGGYDGLGSYLAGEAACDIDSGETSNFEFMYPMAVQTPYPNDPEEVNRITEGPTRKWWIEADPEMYDVALELFANDSSVVLKNEVGTNTLDYTPRVLVGGNGMSGPTFVDNVRYRQYVFEQFGARCVDMETAAAAHILFQNDKPFLFFRSASDLAGADQDPNVMMIFFSLAAENAFTVTSAFIKALYPPEEDAAPGEESGATTKRPMASGLVAVFSSLIMLASFSF